MRCLSGHSISVLTFYYSKVILFPSCCCDKMLWQTDEKGWISSHLWVPSITAGLSQPHKPQGASHITWVARQKPQGRIYIVGDQRQRIYVCAQFPFFTYAVQDVSCVSSHVSHCHRDIPHRHAHRLTWSRQPYAVTLFPNDYSKWASKLIITMAYWKRTGNG